MPKLLLLTRRTLCTLYESSKQYQQLAKRDHPSILTKNDRNWYPVIDISTFKLPSYCILCAQHGARCITRRNNRHNSRNAITRRYLLTMTTIAFPIDILLRLDAKSTAFYA
jgi:hypothetical protein